MYLQNLNIRNFLIKQKKKKSNYLEKIIKRNSFKMIFLKARYDGTLRVEH